MHQGSLNSKMAEQMRHPYEASDYSFVEMEHHAVPREEKPCPMDINRKIGMWLVICTGAIETMYIGLTTKTPRVTVCQGLRDG